MTDTNESKGKVRENVDDMVNELTRMADEIRLKIHLGSMDAKDSWKKLEPKLTELEREGERVVDRTGAEFKDLAQDLKQRFRKLRDDLGG